eukprot:TRINITY_DN33496_c0_g1_i1.p3 TRINITY_DN33496_c0_g1~~TRINITY_DN33496_c0_g1_i1.p3  ORF type:complete len:166 (-),score=39.00 TRINITY_DN33496_c0_g1_i1:789-1286(-)
MARKCGSFSSGDLLDRYIDFMTTPGSHNDCYASTSHRMFFANRKSGKALKDCPDNDYHNVDTLDGLAMAIPVALAAAVRDAETGAEEVASCIDVTRRSEECKWYGNVLYDMLRKLMKGKPLAAVVKEAAAQVTSRLDARDMRMIRFVGWFNFNEEAWARRDPSTS